MQPICSTLSGFKVNPLVVIPEYKLRDHAAEKVFVTPLLANI